MYPRTEYEMTEEQLASLLEACKPVPVIMIGGFAPSSPQENANHAWAALGKILGFDHMTVRPLPGKGHRFFTAVPSESEEVRKERKSREAEERRQSEIKRLTAEIARLEAQLSKLKE